MSVCSAIDTPILCWGPSKFDLFPPATSCSSTRRPRRNFPCFSNTSSDVRIKPCSSFYPLHSVVHKADTVPHSVPFPLTKHICRAVAEYKFPDPIPEFADAETEKFRTHLLNKLSKKDVYGDSVNEVVGICTEIFSSFLHSEYGGPGTLMVIPFIDMADTLHERGLPGASMAARVAVKWAQNFVDKDWKEWTVDEN